MGRDERSGVDRREEILTHIRIEADRLIEEGVDPSEAMAQARKRFGNVDLIETASSRARVRVGDVVWRDVRHGVHRLIAAPVATATILLSLVIGVGVNTAIFSLADQVLVRPLPVSNPDQIVQMEWEGNFIGGGRGYGRLLPHPLYLSLAESQSVFSAMAARSPGEATLLTPAGQGSAIGVALARDRTGGVGSDPVSRRRTVRADPEFSPLHGPGIRD